MRKFICSLLIVLMSMSLLAETTTGNDKKEVVKKVATTTRTDENKSPEVEKEISGIDKSKTDEGRELLEGQDKDVVVQDVDTNIITTNNQMLAAKPITYGQEEDNDKLLKEIGEVKTRPNYVVWGLGILGVLVAGLALSSK